VDDLTGVSLLPEGPSDASERGERVAKTEPVSAMPRSKLVSARGASKERDNVKNEPKIYLNGTLFQSPL